MIAEKLERSLDNLERLAKRQNGDLEALLPDLTAAMRAEVDRVRAFERNAVVLPPGWQLGLLLERGGHHA